jgi:hypothetical protein
MPDGHESAPRAHHGDQLSWAKDFHTIDARLSCTHDMHATASIPAYAYFLANLQSLDLAAFRDDATYNLMTRNNGIVRQPPIVVHRGKVGMAEPAVLDGDLNLQLPGAYKNMVPAFDSGRGRPRREFRSW